MEFSLDWNLCSILYSAPGNIVDWMYARQKIKYSFVVHLLNRMFLLTTGSLP